MGESAGALLMSDFQQCALQNACHSIQNWIQLCKVHITKSYTTLGKMVYNLTKSDTSLGNMQLELNWLKI